MLDIIKFCFKHGAKLEVDFYGRSPLHYAAMYGYTDTCIYFISIGADLNLVDQDGNTALIYTIINGHTDTLSSLVDLGATFEPLPLSQIPVSIACQYGRLEILQNLLSKGIKLVSNLDGLFPLHVACRAGKAEITRALIQYGAEYDAKDLFGGWTPLFFAASEGKLECVRILLEAGAEKDIRDESGWMPWTFALYHGHVKVAELLETLDVPSEVHAEMEVDELKPTGFLVEEEEMNSMGVSSIFKTIDIGAGKSSGGNGDGFASNLDELDIDNIPSLSLPPPIIPLRI
jgi:CDK inhibitor PHO81